MRKKLKEKQWYNGAVVACIGVTLFVVLTNLRQISGAVSSFFGNFSAIFLAIVIAYILNPLAKFFYYIPFKKLKNRNTAWTISAILAFLTALLIVALLIMMVIPQIVQSISLFSQNIESYSASLLDFVQGSAFEKFLPVGHLSTLSENAMDTISSFLQDNSEKILNMVANSGSHILTVLIAIILAVYLLMAKSQVSRGFWRFVRLLTTQERYEGILDFSLRCDTILMSYLYQSILDALIVGSVNAVFMLICRMPYVALISMIVAVTNLVPNFGPVIGGIFSGFILLLVNARLALMFIVFTCVLQFVDAYILKPKLFSNSLGVSGLLILIMSIVLGNLAGVVGILLAIPTAAVLSFVYNDYYLPRKEQSIKNKQKDFS